MKPENGGGNAERCPNFARQSLRRSTIDVQANLPRRCISKHGGIDAKINSANQQNTVDYIAGCGRRWHFACTFGTQSSQTMSLSTYLRVSGFSVDSGQLWLSSSRVAEFRSRQGLRRHLRTAVGLPLGNAGRHFSGLALDQLAVTSAALSCTVECAAS